VFRGLRAVGHRYIWFHAEDITESILDVKEASLDVVDLRFDFLKSPQWAAGAGKMQSNRTFNDV
jgi:3-dehydroquinate dehydratase